MRLGRVLETRSFGRSRSTELPPEATHFVVAPRELDVLRCKALGMRDAEIAAELNLSVFTVKDYVKRARLGLGARNTDHAIYLAMRRGLIQ